MLKADYETTHARAMSGSAVAQVLNLIVSGSSSNWWGLGCPSHCSASFGTYFFVWGSGFSAGASTTCAPVPQASHSASAAAAPASYRVFAAPPCTSFATAPSGSRTLRFRPPVLPFVSGTVPAECIHLCSSLAVCASRAQRAWAPARFCLEAA